MRVKSLVLIVFALLMSLFVFGQGTYCVFGVSDEVIGLGFDYFNSNNGRYAQAGVYECFASDYDILIYSGGSLVGNFECDEDLVGTDSTLGFYKLNIFEVNSTFIGWVFSYRYGDIYHRFKSGVFEVATLTATVLGTTTSGDTGSASYYSGTLGQVVFEVGSSVYSYMSYGQQGDGVYSMFIKAYPTHSNLNSSYDILPDLYGGSVVVPNDEDSSEVFIVTRDSDDGDRCTVLLADVSNGYCEVVGSTGIDGTWGDFVYYFGYSYDTDGTSSWTDVGVVHDCSTVEETIIPMVLRFNETYVNYTRSTLSVSSSVSVVRPITVWYSGLMSEPVLTEGTFLFVFVGDDYEIYKCPFDVSDLDSVSPSCTITYSPTVYGDDGVPYEHYYDASTDVGALQPFGETSVLVYDVDGGKAVLDGWTAMNPSNSYTYVVTPAPTYQLDNDFQIYKNKLYTYMGEIWSNQIRQGDGTFTCEVTVGRSYWSDDYHSYTSGSINNGLFSFYLSPVSSSLDIVFVKLRVNYTIDSETYSVVHRVVYTGVGFEDDEELEGNPDGDSGYDGSNSWTEDSGWVSLPSVYSFILYFVILGFPPILLSGYGAKHGWGQMGLMFGAIYSTGVGVMLGVMPFWLVTVVWLFVVFAVIKMKG